MGGAAKAGATLIASITTIRATTLNNTTMRFFMHYLLLCGDGPPSGALPFALCLPITIDGPRADGMRQMTHSRGMGENESFDVVPSE
jgi:hypothetical protein